MLRLRGGIIEPSLIILAKKYNCDKLICRKVGMLAFRNTPATAARDSSRVYSLNTDVICGYTYELCRAFPAVRRALVLETCRMAARGRRAQ